MARNPTNTEHCDLTFGKGLLTPLDADSSQLGHHVKEERNGCYPDPGLIGSVCQKPIPEGWKACWEDQLAQKILAFCPWSTRTGSMRPDARGCIGFKGNPVHLGSAAFCKRKQLAKESPPL